jgi:hypothetical protein
LEPVSEDVSEPVTPSEEGKRVRRGGRGREKERESRRESERHGAKEREGAGERERKRESERCVCVWGGGVNLDAARHADVAVVKLEGLVEAEGVVEAQPPLRRQDVLHLHTHLPIFILYYIILYYITSYHMVKYCIAIYSRRRGADAKRLAGCPPSLHTLLPPSYYIISYDITSC